MTGPWRIALRVAIQTYGTRGDVQPYIALASGLMSRGHEVQLAGPEQFSSMACEYKIPFVPLPGSMLALIDTPEGRSALASGKGFSAGFKLLQHVRPMMRQLLDAEWSALQQFAPHVIVHHPKSIASPHIAEALGVPSILASPLPGFTPTSYFPSPMLPFSNLGPLNKASHTLAIKGAELIFGKLIRQWRTTSLHLSKHRTASSFPSRTLYAYSRHVVPVPPDWGSDVLVSGYWFVDSSAWQPTEPLAAFLGDGDPPVYIGFGSMPGLDPEKLTNLVMESLAMTGKRGILATGGGALSAGATSPNIHIIEGAPHDRVFPRVSGVIHHGGAGTTAAALRAGKPSAICPFFGDQPFWAKRIASLGAGPEPLERKKLSAHDLALAIKAMDSDAVQRKADEIGTAIRKEDGSCRGVY
ncbi:glycosyltransferase [Phyllobacterium endophyticum]|uniref:glycosyltransferase n=1 Tax=Phyllobacterium endophyticum TaxID=1149773 RepID=UPI003CCE88A1